jgi:hypothetical protein
MMPERRTLASSKLAKFAHLIIDMFFIGPQRELNAILQPVRSGLP